MRAFEFLREDETPAPKKVGREFNHLEDKVFSEPNGALKAIHVLKGLESPEQSITLKWDGNPTVYWGRDEDGTFRMVGKNNWGREEGKSSSPEELEQFILSRGKKEDWREKFAGDMAAMWPIFEKATPTDFRGYVYGDILFHPGKPYEGADGRISFTPNQTTYGVKVNSPYFQKLSKAKIAVAAHKQYEYFGDTTGEDFDNPERFSTNPDLALFGLTAISHRPAVNADNLAKIESLAKHQQAIDKMLEPIVGMGYLRDEIYKFMNSQAKAKALDKVNSEAFFNFESKTPAKLAKIQAHSEKFPGVLDKMFELVRELMLAKNEIISELDAAAGDIEQSTDGKPGGEGYISGGSKLVPRDRWTPFRAD